MCYRRLGRSGLRISALSLGSYVTFADQVDLPLAKELLRTAFDAGVNFFDNAETYAAGDSERLMGRAIAELGWPRDAFLISSKVFFGALADPGPLQRGLHRKNVVEACHQALERLRVDYLDLYFCHRPDPETPVEETVRAMHDLVRQGKVLYWGTSEWPARRIRQAYRVAERHGLTPPTMEQPQYNLLNRDRLELEYAHLYRRHGLGTTTWGPLRSGLLSGKYAGGTPEGTRLARPGHAELRAHLSTAAGREKLRVIDRLAVLAARLDATPAQLAIAWCLVNPHVSSVILGASSLEQLTENLGALDLLPRLDADVRREIEAILATLPRPGLGGLPGGRWLAALRHALG